MVDYLTLRMIIDQLSQIHKYASLHPLFANAISYLQSTDFNTIPTGEVKVQGEDIRAIIIEDELVAKEVSTAGFECHNTYIDIQYIVNGQETVGWKPRSTCISPKDSYSEERDVLFFADEPDMYFQLASGQFGIYFPGDVHAPMIGAGKIRKVVMKVRV